MKIQKLFIFGVLISSLSAQPVIHKPPQYDPVWNFNSNRVDPEGEEIVNPAEFGRTDGIFLAWSGWDQQLIADIAQAVSHDYLVYLLVADTDAEEVAFNFLHDHDVNMANVFFIQDPDISNSSMWIRDYAPFFIKEDGAQAIDDFIYGTYWTDDFVSYTIADYFEIPIYDSNLLHHGGNHISDGNGMAFCSDNIFIYNSQFSETEVREEFRDFFGIDSLVVVEPMQGDGTHHIDMFCKLLNDTLFIVGEYDPDTECYPGDREILNDLAEYLGSLSNLDGLPFTVERIPMGPYTYGGPAATINYTYTNSLIVNDLVLVPVYGLNEDAEALQVYRDLLPDHEIIGINSEFIIQYWGAVHCVTSEYFSENPLIILHKPLAEFNTGESPVIEFRLNPRFAESSASIFYRSVSQNDFIEVAALLDRGIWRAQLPQLSESIEYYISGSASSGDYNFQTYLPETAPLETFFALCSDSPVTGNYPAALFRLYNYPNPFNPDTEISFQLPREEYVILTIYNLKGQVVKYLISEELQKGQHSICWDGRNNYNQNAVSGIYLCQLKTPSQKIQHKILLLK